MGRFSAHFLIIMLLAGSGTLFGQKYNFRHYGPPELPDQVVYSLTQDNDGFLWVGTGNGLFRYDGFIFRQVNFPDSGSLRFPTTLFRDSRGVVWVGGSDGSLHCYTGNTLASIDSVRSQRINDIKESPEGDVFVVTQNNGIYVLAAGDNNKLRHLAAPGGVLLYSLGFASENTILAGTNENLLLMSFRGDSLVKEAAVEGIEYTKVTSIVRPAAGGVFFAGTESNGVFLVRPDDGVLRALPVSDDEDLSYLRVQSIFSDREGSLWVSTYGSGVIKLHFDTSGSNITNIRLYNSATGLSADDARVVFQDNEGNFWIGLYGEGLNQLVSEAFTFYQPGLSGEDNNIIFVGSNGSDYLLGSTTGLHHFDLFTGTATRFESVTASTSGVPATSYYAGDDGSLWIGTGGAGLYLRDRNGIIKQFYRSFNSGENYISAITSFGENIWLSTRNGVVVVNRRNGSTVRKFTTTDKLPHNNINQVFIDISGRAMIATEAANIYYADMDGGITTGNIQIEGSVRNIITGFTQAPDGSYWIATNGNGVFYINGDSVNTLNSTDGMMSNFCYSILADSESRLWVGHERGFSRFDPVTGSMSVFSTSFARGGDCNHNAIFESAGGIVFIGTTNGLIVYDRKKDLRSVVPPGLNITSITVNDRVYPFTPHLLLPYNRYVVRIDYVGISLSNPGLVRYRTRLDNYDTDWSDQGNVRNITYRLTDGTFRFSIEAVNEAGVASLEDSVIEITVRKPVWRRWWFAISALLVMSGAIVVIIRVREAAQIRMREHLEELLRQRTSEVVKQKEEIEQQNLEITDSINYARRIQASILPDIAKLRQSFRDAFIIFIPRDIVSGDFYWFDKIGEERFILACADSTGHGVPGAFMSMIGSTLLQDIITRKNVTRPSEILSLLDEQIFSTLNRNIDVGVSNDGMDMVICEFNLKNRHVRFASAMRPVIMIMDGEPVYIKGNRSSVGGEAYVEKFFADQEYYLNEGDAIYLFSDGFPDQFGGDDGKKMKVARLKKLIEEIMPMSMDEQKDYITRFFYDWKGDHEQVDDILFMGIRF
ncbi:MAG: two-component regulator propeller domain-containing protein [Bacteroidales bacterium]|nr:two-component regulator propeller domain-containing protein [Bacteroidales bacterium]